MNIQRTITRTENSITTSNLSIINFILNNETELIARNINSRNVNNIIDRERGYTALHYAIQFHKYKIIEYLLQIGADPLIKTKSNENSYDLGIKYQCKDVIMYKLNENDKTISELTKKNKLNEDNITYMSKAMDEGNIKITTLKKENIDLKNKNIELNKKYNNTVTDLTIENNLLKTENEKINNDYSNIKRKHDDLQLSFNSLSKRMRK